MKQSMNIHDLLRPLSRFFGRYHGIIFFLFVGAGLGTGMFIIISIFGISGATDMTNVTVNRTFDEVTLKRVQELKSEENSDSKLVLPKGRTNPFVEQ